MSGHLPCTDTLSMSRHISTLNYLRSADTCLTRTRTVIYWLSVPAITDSSNKCHVFGGHFNPKSLAAGSVIFFPINAPVSVIFFPINAPGMGRFQLLNLGGLGYGLELRFWVVIAIIVSLTLSITLVTTII